MTMRKVEVAEELKEQLPEAIEGVYKLKEKPLLLVKRDSLVEVCSAAKELGFDFLMCIAGIDRPEEGVLEATYNLYSYERREHLVIKARCPREEALLPSVTSVWKAALFLERETYDLVGISFEGHPDLRRILLPEPWQGHPLRKDYDMEKEQFVSKGPQGEDIVTANPKEGW
jgi:NADH-quinone oxidoreductase subunit C